MQQPERSHRVVVVMVDMLVAVMESEPWSWSQNHFAMESATYGAPHEQAVFNLSGSGGGGGGVVVVVVVMVMV